MNVPGTMSSITDINATDLVYEDWFKIGEETFYLRSVVILNKVFAALAPKSVEASSIAGSINPILAKTIATTNAVQNTV